MGQVIALLLLAIALAGCTHAAGGFCAVADPLRLSAQAVDQMSDAEVKAALAHNRKGQQLCGWKP